jgi:cellulose synthase/poly-beta-1,6-N-acetylglucosamine synthase-like glycosyltransferase
MVYPEDWREPGSECALNRPSDRHPLQSSAGDNIDVSLIICTRDRCRQLARCLQAVRRITFERSWELVIVDNGSVDKTAIVVKEDFSSTSCIPVVYVFEPRPGLANGHNAALRTARGEILAFTDDDCYPEQDFLMQVWAAFADPSVGYLTGRIMLHASTDYRITINESMTPLIFPGGSFVRAGAVQGANMAFRRRVLFDMGGFDPLFGPGSRFNAEDADAAGRASAMGWNGLYCPGVTVSHDHGRKARDVALLERSYAIGRGAYLMKLLLHGRRFMWFARGIYDWRWRVRFSGGLLWEMLGLAQYGYLFAKHAFRNKFGGRQP